jgi:membrane-bound lytic murein transglycosylase D
MRRLIWPILLGFFLSATSLPGQSIPNPVSYCGLEIELSSEAERKVSELVRQLQVSPRYFNQMVQRALCYMPFIEEALTEAGAPDDMKYLAIQESSLMPSAVSTSNAVGFWQFKGPTAKEMGLRVDDRIDERRHIFRASLAAGRYLAKVNQDFDNWAYAVIAYREGPTGAVPYTNPLYYSQDKMRLSGEAHIYLLKAIAHKIAYQSALQRPQRADQYLVPHSTVGETNLSRLATEHGISLATLLEYNAWILEDRRLPPTERPFTYYVPVAAEDYLGHRPDPTKGIQSDDLSPVAEAPPVEVTDLPGSDPEAKPATEVVPAPPADNSPQPVGLSTPSQSLMPRAVDPRQLQRSSYAVFPIRADLEYGVEYAIAENGRALINLALRHDINLTKLMQWNGFSAEEKPVEGQIIYLKKPKKAKYHVVLPGESLADIAMMHRSKVRRIQRKNRMGKEEYTIYIGQKLYLKSKKPKDEKLIVLVEKWIPQESYTPLSLGQVATPVPPSAATTASVESQPVVEPVPPRPKSKPVRPSMPVAKPEPRAVPPVIAPTAEPSAADERRIWINHRVEAGETLWKISQRYETKVEIIKRSNALSTDAIHPGQTLKVLVRSSVLKRLATAATRD